METFLTIQGEGFHTGRSAWFVRLGGCDVGCTWCDVKESWDPSAHPLRSVQELVQEASATSTRFVVITGGEPAMYDLGPLTRFLHEAGFTIAVETSGAYPLTGDLDWVCVSPKKFKAPLPEMLERADELKVVVYHPSDFEWAEKHAAPSKSDCMLYLQPEHSRFEERIGAIIDYVKQHPRWRISLQTHKFLNI
jgi:organic radical activating enzyme